MILEAKPREILGKSVKTLRKQGAIPAVLYGHNISNLNLSLDYRNFEKTYKESGESAIFQIKVESENAPRNVLIHDIEFDSISGRFRHIDLYQVRMDVKVKTKVPVEFGGESPAVKNGNILVKNIHEIEVEALPANLPKSIIVDISNLKEINDKVLVSQLNISKEARVIAEPAMIVAIIEEPRAQEEIPTTKPEEAISEIKTVSEEKRKEKEKDKEKESAAEPSKK